MSEPERVDLRHLAPQPWRNGAGLTREIAVHPPGAGADGFDWRVSVAELDRAAPFSVFAGVERHIVLLDGAGLVLASADSATHHRLDRRGEPFRFAGEAVVDADPIAGPTRDFNVMTRRSAFTAEVGVHDSGIAWPAGPAALLFCAEGVWRGDGLDAPALEPGQAWWWRHATPAIRLRAAPAGCLVAVRFHPAVDR